VAGLLGALTFDSIDRGIEVGNGDPPPVV